MTDKKGLARKGEAKAKKSKAEVSTALETPTILPAETGLDLVEALTSTGTTVDAGFKPPVWVAPFVAGFRAISALPVGTHEERVKASATFLATCEAALPNTPMPAAKNSGRFSGEHIFESQNGLYLAAALANVKLGNGHLVAAWRAECPLAKCDYLNKVDYPTSTLGEYLANRHAGVPGVPGAFAVIKAWADRKRQPLVPTGK